MAITDLTGTTWEINDVPVISANATYYIDFTTTNGGSIRNYTRLLLNSRPSISYRENGDYTPVYYVRGWSAAHYQTISIVAGLDITNAALISWLESNATQVLPSDVSIIYNGSKIGALSDSGTKTLKTQGKYCTDDITIEYTKQGGGGGGVGEVVFEGSMAITNTTNLWEYINENPNTSAYIVLLQDLYINNHRMDFLPEWTVYGYIIQNVDLPVATPVRDAYDDYNYTIRMFTSGWNQESKIQANNNPSLRANITKIVKVVL